MPGRSEHVEGEVRHVEWVSTYEPRFDVSGLQAILKKFVGKKVSVMVEETDE